MTNTHVTTSTYDRSRDNALRHGVLARSAVLPWEDQGEFDALLESLVAEHAPAGPIERYLVQELATVMWRRRRLYEAERASHGRSLGEVIDGYGTVRAATAHLPDRPARSEGTEWAVRATTDETAEDHATTAADEAAVCRALDVLENGGAEAIDAALRLIPQPYRDKAMRRIGGGPRSRDPEAVGRILRRVILGPLAEHREQLEIRPLVRAQAIGDAVSAVLLGPHARYEAHLDRKFLRLLVTLVRLQSLRRDMTTTTS